VPTTTAPTTTVVVAPTPTTIAKPSQSDPIWAIPDGIEVAVAGADGLHLLTGVDDRVISADVFEDVAADPSGGGWLVQSSADFEDPNAPPSIRRIGDDGSDKAVVTAEEGTTLQLHDTAIVDGHATLFYNVNHQHDGALDTTGDEVFARDLVTGTSRKIAEAGGWESQVVLNFGGDALVGLEHAEGTVIPFSVDLTGHEDAIDMNVVGLAAIYDDNPTAPRAVTISPDGARLSWISSNVTDDLNYIGNHLNIASADWSDSRVVELPAGPTLMNDLIDHGDYLLIDTGFTAEGEMTPGMLVDAETGGILILPTAGPAAATGEWNDVPRWPIPSVVSEDVTNEIRALEPQWAGGPLPYEETLAKVLLGNNDNGGECAAVARSFPTYTSGDGPFWIEFSQPCDDSIAGALYEVTIVGPQPDGSLTGGAMRRVLCKRGVTTDGLCV
jgi:hypothetical protein